MGSTLRYLPWPLMQALPCDAAACCVPWRKISAPLTLARDAGARNCRGWRSRRFYLPSGWANIAPPFDVDVMGVWLEANLQHDRYTVPQTEPYVLIVHCWLYYRVLAQALNEFQRLSCRACLWTTFLWIATTNRLYIYAFSITIREVCCIVLLKSLSLLWQNTFWYIDAFVVCAFTQYHQEGWYRDSHVLSDRCHANWLDRQSISG